MKVLFTCGGTAGHINPAVALAGMFRQRQNAEVLFVGADGGMETTLVPREGYPVKTVTITSFYRSLSGAAIKHNLTTLKNLSRSKGQARAILDEFRPDRRRTSAGRRQLHAVCADRYRQYWGYLLTRAHPDGGPLHGQSGQTSSPGVLLPPQ